MIDPKVSEVTGKNASLNINEGKSASAIMGKGKGKSIGRGRGGGGVRVSSKYGSKRRGRGMGIDQISEGRNTLRPNGLSFTSSDLLVSLQKFKNGIGFHNHPLSRGAEGVQA